MNIGKEQALVELLYKAKTRTEIDYLVQQIKDLKKELSSDTRAIEPLPDIQVLPYGDMLAWYNKNCGKCIARCRYEEEIALAHLAGSLSFKAVDFVGYIPYKPLNEYKESNRVDINKNCRHKTREDSVRDIRKGEAKWYGLFIMLLAFTTYAERIINEEK
jgi:hypothetical protein